MNNLPITHLPQTVENLSWSMFKLKLSRWKQMVLCHISRLIERLGWGRSCHLSVLWLYRQQSLSSPSPSLLLFLLSFSTSSIPSFPSPCQTDKILHPPMLISVQSIYSMNQQANRGSTEWRGMKHPATDRKPVLYKLATWYLRPVTSASSPLTTIPPESLQIQFVGLPQWLSTSVSALGIINAFQKLTVED